MPTVTICIPSYNHERTVRRAIDSALAQHGADIEILVVDDGSADGTVAVAEATGDPRVTVVRNARNLGLVGNHNHCLSIAGGELIQFLHADDQLLPGAVAALAPCFGDADVVLAFAPRLVDSDDAAWVERYGSLHARFSALGSVNAGDALLREYIEAGRVKGNWIGEPSSVMFRADAARAVGGFDPRFVQMLDMDLWARLIAGRKVAWVDEPLSVRSHFGTTASAQNSTAAVAYTDRLLLLGALVRNRRATLRARGVALAWLVVALGRTGLDAARRDPLGRELRTTIRRTRWRPVRGTG